MMTITEELYYLKGNIPAQYLYTALALLGLLLVIKFILPPKESAGKSKHCSSPNCVRCSNYKDLRKQSQVELEKFIQKNGINGMERLKRNVGNLPHKDCMQQPNVLYIKELKAKPWWDINEDEMLRRFNIQVLTDNYTAIHNEYMAVVSDINNISSGWTTNVTETGSWNTFYIYNQGVKIEQNSVRCPTITKILENDLDTHFVKGCVFGNAFFSRLLPGTCISEHYGPSNTRIRCHLGLQTPKGYELTVAGIKKSWVERDCIIFDDSFLHEVRHCPTAATDPRVVLIVDIWHPELSCKEKEALCEVYKL